jgi:hypothetical protein
VSLSDITQLLGTGSVPVVVAGSVLGVFELGERLASQRAKDALSKWLVSFDLRRAGALPDGTQELFERIFGKRHFSLKCLIRSVAFSLGAMIFIGILAFLIDPKGVMTGLPVQLGPVRYGAWLQGTLWLPLSILIDYLSLFKTRVILRVLTRIHLRSTIVAFAVAGIDYVVYLVIFSLSMSIMLSAWLLINFDPPTRITCVWDFLATLIFMVRELVDIVVHDILSSFYIHMSRLFPVNVFFWAGFAPSIWMWLYVLALFVTRALLRSERVVNRLRWSLDVEKNPFRSIGAVAAALAFIASVAILLVSAEVSRISGAA